MINLLTNSLASAGQTYHINTVLILGIAIFGGTVGARLFQRLRIPQVVGYVAIGILVGPILKIIDLDMVNSLEPFNFFALGIIGFLVGGELKRDIFVKFGKQAISILVFEGVTAFLTVGTLSFLITWYFIDLPTAIAVGVVFGAICTATDPASTVQVLWEYKCRGPVSTMLTAIVALDDALALVLYAIAVSIAGVFMGASDVSFFSALAHSLGEIVFSLIQGIVAGFILTYILKHTREHEKILAFTISSVLLSIGFSIMFHLDVILAAMALGVTMTNLAPRRTRLSFEMAHKFASPIYVLFFVLVGARLQIENIKPMVAMLIAAYYFGSIIGKTAGSYWGARYAGANDVIRKYLGFCLYPQGGIAVGLLIAATHHGFSPQISQIIVMVVVTGVFLLQITGPICARIGLGKAGEVGMNISEEDLIESFTVADVYESDAPIISAETSITGILSTFAETDVLYYPVVDRQKKLIGAITMDGVRNTFTTTGSNDWLIALDIMEPIIKKAKPDLPLKKALAKMSELDILDMPVVDVSEELKGVFNARSARRKVSTILLEKQRQADAAHGSA